MYITVCDGVFDAGLAGQTVRAPTGDDVKLAVRVEPRVLSQERLQRLHRLVHVQVVQVKGGGVPVRVPCRQDHGGRPLVGVSEFIGVFVTLK